jgi:GT2 family glycosyltransferase
MTPELSIVVPTCERAGLLRRCLASLVAGVECEHEIIVVDGASTDGTASVLSEARSILGERLVVIREMQRGGFVRAANAGFAAARGRCLTWINDDARPLPGALDAAVGQLHRSPPGVGLLAMFHRSNATRNVAYEADQGGQRYRLFHVRGTLYANFAMGRADTFNRLGFFDQRFYVNGADPDLSLKAWHAGLRVEPAMESMIDHDEHVDARRYGDADRGAGDNAALFAKWDLPPRDPWRNTFDPAHPCTLRGLRSGNAIAA